MDRICGQDKKLQQQTVFVAKDKEIKKTARSHKNTPENNKSLMNVFMI